LTLTGNIVLREAEQGATFPALFAAEFDDDILRVFIASRGTQQASSPHERSDMRGRLGGTDARRSGCPARTKDSQMMAKSSDQVASVQELVARFLSIELAQYDAAYVIDTRKYNRLYANMQDVRNELRKREGDQRRALLPLLDHPNVQVRMMAANTLLAISPDLARKALESVRDSEIFPQAMDAGMMLRGLDDGSYIPS
jgi:hypothetical protein